jgi:glyoxylase-like metal-dependent hydrolase (beta-lactamase superfamily II)
MIFHQAFTLNQFRENTYIIWDSQGIGIIVDPGCYTYEERLTLKNFIEEKNITLTHILNTHAHIDHVLGVEYIRQEYKIPFYLHPKDEPLLKDSSNRAQVYGFPHYQPSEVDVWYEEDQILQIGEMEIKILFVPGHAPGHIALYFEKEGLLFDGDVLFRQSIGRTDFALCNHAD